MILVKAERERDEYIMQVTREHPDWRSRQVAAEVARVYGKCSHTHVIKVWKKNGIVRNDRQR